MPPVRMRKSSLSYVLTHLLIALVGDELQQEEGLVAHALPQIQLPCSPRLPCRSTLRAVRIAWGSCLWCLQ